jgi:hypothetical protein
MTWTCWSPETRVKELRGPAVRAVAAGLRTRLNDDHAQSGPAKPARHDRPGRPSPRDDHVADARPFDHSAAHRSKTISLASYAACPRRVADFWLAALAWAEAYSHGDEIGIEALDDPEDRIPAMVFWRTDNPRPSKNRLHLDLRARDVAAKRTTPKSRQSARVPPKARPLTACSSGRPKVLVQPSTPSWRRLPL